MKIAKINLFAIPLFLSVVFCNQLSGQNSLSQDLIRKIANDSLYHQLSKVKLDLGLAMMRDEFDAQAAVAFLGQLEKPYAICDLPDEQFAAIRGGLIFKKIDCARAVAFRNLIERYPEYAESTRADRLAMYEIYLQHHPMTEFNRELTAVMQERNKTGN
ncbi:MAG TPA: hypothetical protein PKB07_02080 [Flavilitoribacter sp.]|nr:hypothetical protein [Flavilitoribacter sp.]